MADIKLKDLRYLVAVADTGHFGKAAARCFVSQPTLSAQLRKLEEYLGVDLIERQPRQALLTPAGVEVVARARRIVEASDEVVEIALSHRDPLAGKLRIAFLPTIGPYLLPFVVQRLHKALPRLELMLHEHQTEPMLERLRAGDIDMGVLALPVELDGLHAEPLYDEPFVVAMPTAHPLAERKQLRAEDLRGATLLLLEEGHCLRDQALEVCSRVPVREKQDFRGTSLETLRQMVAADAGITLLPELATRGAYAQSRGVVIRPFAKPVPARRIGAIWRKSSPRGAALAAVAEVIAEHAT
ncbi:MAG: LysR substrate-binding domain-containing protein [Gammaproteobacteria bacterium]